MDFAGMNHLAIPLAAVASYAFGSVWYMTLAKPWMAALGKTEADLKAGPQVRPFVMAFVMQLLMAWVLAGLIGHLGTGQVTLANGVISAAFCWAGFVLTTLVTNHGFQDAKGMLTVIDGGHWLGVLLIQGAVIGAMGI